MAVTTITLKNLEKKYTLLEYLRPYGINAPCGGKGKCGKCMVKVNGEYVSACSTRMEGDASVEIPEMLYGSAKRAAVDIGTTNVVVLLDGKTLLKEPNAQQSYGADVLTRIEACRDGHGEELTNLIRNQVKRLTGEAELFIAGNTVMELLYQGYDVSSIGVPPFTPATLTPGRNMAPCVSGYVGGDIVAGLATVSEDPPYLFVDIGTNGEIALVGKNGIETCACAAGPAFEYGAAGLKGSEVIDEVARLKREGLLGKSGKLKGESILSQDDIHSVQLAKGAVRGAIETLLRNRKAERIFIAGDFGGALNIENAVEIGLLPECETAVLGNTSLKGAQAALEGTVDLNRIAGRCTYTDLSSSDDFSKYFLRYINFEQ